MTTLFDFGLVTHCHDAESAIAPHEASPFAGSLLYVSPEQSAGEKMDGRTNVYTLGRVGYFLLTGRPPFERKTTWSLMQAHAKDSPDRPSMWNPSPSKELEDVLMKV